MKSFKKSVKQTSNNIQNIWNDLKKKIRGWQKAVKKLFSYIKLQLSIHVKTADFRLEIKIVTFVKTWKGKGK